MPVARSVVDLGPKEDYHALMRKPLDFVDAETGRECFAGYVGNSARRRRSKISVYAAAIAFEAASRKERREL